jgi:hypothetical protein
MLKPTMGTLAIAVLLAPAAGAQEMKAGRTITLTGEMQRGYQETQRTLLEASEKMPDEHYAFKPTPEIKPFGQLVAHTALSQFGTCAMIKGEPNPRKDEKEETSRTKTEAVALLKASTAYCDPVVSAVTEANRAELVKVGPNQVERGLVAPSLIVHAMEMYGTMAVYLRLKGIVPPTTERQNQMKKSQ